MISGPAAGGTDALPHRWSTAPAPLGPALVFGYRAGRAAAAATSPASVHRELASRRDGPPWSSGSASLARAAEQLRGRRHRAGRSSPGGQSAHNRPPLTKDASRTASTRPPCYRQRASTDVTLAFRSRWSLRTRRAHRHLDGPSRRRGARIPRARRRHRRRDAAASSTRHWSGGTDPTIDDAAAPRGAATRTPGGRAGGRFVPRSPPRRPSWAQVDVAPAAPPWSVPSAGGRRRDSASARGAGVRFHPPVGHGGPRTEA